ncbi:MAG TPA: hypothetical protein EYP14_02245 [Planctomycetaceae bacterium]|nr:hypothetical protein [Planctomycetaceae bacterium]
MPQAQLWMDESFDAAAAEQYAELVREVLRRGLWLSSVRIPGRARYLAALDEAVHRAVRDGASPGDCLRAAAGQWRQLTTELGLEAQRAAYWRSLGMEP